MLFTEGLAVMVTSIVGAGVFGLPEFAKNLGWMSAFYLLLAYLFSILLARVVLSFTPGTLDEEFERAFGKKYGKLTELLDMVISLLALTAYIVGVQSHLQANIFILLFFMFIPLMFHLHFPASFSIGLTAVIVAFMTSLSFVNLKFAGGFPATGFSPAFGGMLLAAAYFAFFGHNMIPRVRTIIQHTKEAWKAIIISFTAVFVLYALFTLTTIPIGGSGLSTVVLSRFYEGSTPSTIALFAALIFYTSFILIGLHLQEKVGHTPRASLLTVVAALALYALTEIFSIPFSSIIASAGFAVSLYAVLAGVTALKIRKKQKKGERSSIIALLVLSGLPWLLLVLGSFLG